MNIEHDAKIAQRAYELWKSKGQRHGRDLNHWLQAEAEFGIVESRPEIAPHTPKSPSPRRRTSRKR